MMLKFLESKPGSAATLLLDEGWLGCIFYSVFLQNVIEVKILICQ